MPVEPTRHAITGLLTQNWSKHLEQHLAVDCARPYPHEARITVHATPAQETDDALLAALEPFLANGVEVEVTATLEDGRLTATTDDMRIVVERTDG